MDEKQKSFMQRAIDLSISSIENEGGPFGAVIVKDGQIIAEHSNSVTLDNDPTAHAEVNTIRKACQNLETYDLKGCEIYSSCEPCPMCLGAIYWSRLDALYYANTKNDAAAIGFDDSFIYKELDTEVSERRVLTKQLMRSEALKAFKNWDNMANKKNY